MELVDMPTRGRSDLVGCIHGQTLHWTQEYGPIKKSLFKKGLNRGHASLAIHCFSQFTITTIAINNRDGAGSHQRRCTHVFNTAMIRMLIQLGLLYCAYCSYNRTLPNSIGKITAYSYLSTITVQMLDAQRPSPPVTVLSILCRIRSVVLKQKKTTQDY